MRGKDKRRSNFSVLTAGFVFRFGSAFVFVVRGSRFVFVVRGSCSRAEKTGKRRIEKPKGHHLRFRQGCKQPAPAHYRSFWPRRRTLNRT